MDHEKIEHKHVAEDSMTPYQRFMRRVMLRILELSTLELIVAILHLTLTALAVFGIIGASSEGH